MWYLGPRDAMRGTCRDRGLAACRDDRATGAAESKEMRTAGQVSMIPIAHLACRRPNCQRASDLCPEESQL